MVDSRLNGIGMTSARTRASGLAAAQSEQRHSQSRGSSTGFGAYRGICSLMKPWRAGRMRMWRCRSGSGQTISQPWIVARMTEALIEGGAPEEGARDRYLVAATRPPCWPHSSAGSIRSSGSEPLYERARTAQGTGNSKCPSEAWRWHQGLAYPSAVRWNPGGCRSAHAVPDALLKQLAPGGRIVVPIGSEGGRELVRITREEGRLKRGKLGAVAFVPLIQGPVSIA